MTLFALLIIFFSFAQTPQIFNRPAKFTAVQEVATLDTIFGFDENGLMSFVKKSDLLSSIPAPEIPGINAVLNAGNIATIPLNADGGIYNSQGDNTVSIQAGEYILFQEPARTGRINLGNSTGNATWQMPGQSGTLALLGDSDLQSILDNGSTATSPTNVTIDSEQGFQVTNGTYNSTIRLLTGGIDLQGDQGIYMEVGEASQIVMYGETLINDKNAVTSINGVDANTSGEVTITPFDISAIPREGTAFENPVTGDLEFNDSVGLKYYASEYGGNLWFRPFDNSSQGFSSWAVFGDSSNFNALTLTGFQISSGGSMGAFDFDNSDESFAVNLEGAGAVGLKGQQDFSANNDGTDRTLYIQTGWALDRMSKTLADFYINAPNTGTSETPMYSYTLPANRLDENGEKISFVVNGIAGVGVTATTTEIGFKLGASNIGSYTLVSGGDDDLTWEANAIIIRSGSDTARICVKVELVSIITGDVYKSDYKIIDLPGFDFTASNALQLYGQGANATGEIIAKMGTMTWYPAAQ